MIKVVIYQREYSEAYLLSSWNLWFNYEDKGCLHEKWKSLADPLSVLTFQFLAFPHTFFKNTFSKIVSNLTDRGTLQGSILRTQTSNI